MTQQKRHRYWWPLNKLDALTQQRARITFGDMLQQFGQHRVAFRTESNCPGHQRIIATFRDEPLTYADYFKP